MEFTRANASEVDALLEMMREFCAGERLEYDEADRRALLRTMLEDPRLGQVWLMAEERAPAGYFVLGFGFSLEFRGRDAFLDELYVREPWRGRGFGTLALARAEAACREQGVRALHLEADHDNPRAHALYRRVGFRDHPRHLMTKWIL